MKTVLTIVLVASIAVLVACSFSTTFAQSLIAAQTGINVADPAVGAELGKYFSAAITAAENWKSGTPSAEFEEALNVLATNLDLVPLGSKADADIAAAINFIDNEIALLSKAKTAKLELKSPAEQEVYVSAWIESSDGVSGPNGRKHAWTGKPIKSPAQLKKALKKK
ncbi:MAG: hypothetical protein WAK20_01555 [Candidatus Acidiferrum sp.]